MIINIANTISIVFLIASMCTLFISIRLLVTARSQYNTNLSLGKLLDIELDKNYVREMRRRTRIVLALCILCGIIALTGLCLNIYTSANIATRATNAMFLLTNIMLAHSAILRLKMFKSGGRI